MFLLSPPQCDLLSVGSARNSPTFTSECSSLPTWPAPPADALVALRSLQYTIFPQSSSLSDSHKTPSSASHNTLSSASHNTLSPVSHNTLSSSSSHTMSSPHNIPYASPRSPFSPTLGSIQEVFEYEPLDITSQSTTPLTPHDTQEAFRGVLPEPVTAARPTLSVGQRTKGIIVSPRKGRRALAASKATNVLRQVLEADRIRRRRVLRIYLKAIVFLKLLLKSHERYGTIMATSGAYMQR